LFLDRGFGAPETKLAFERAREIASDAEDGSDRLAAQYGLSAGSFVRGELGVMRELMRKAIAGASRASIARS
jgi:hypothetical protein